MKKGLLASRLAWAPLALAAIFSASLLVATALIQRSVNDASILVARGMGEAFAFAGFQALAGTGFPPPQEALDRFVEDHAEDGLRYVGLLSADGGRVASAGTPLGSGLVDGVTLLEDRARLVVRVPSRKLERRAARHRQNGPRRPFPRVVYEFEPLAALELQRRADNLFVIAALFSVGAFGLAAALSAALRQRETFREELEHGRRLAALGSMSAVLAHELRNPLASAKGHAQLLAESVERDAGLSPKAELVVTEVVRVERLLNDLLDFVKSGELRRETVDPGAVLTEAIASTGERGRIELPLRDPLPAATVDPRRLQQALENVLRNALEASPTGGRVVAEARVEGAELVYAVHDSGPGIPAGEEARIFEPFVTGRIQGVGLGLAITRRIVELHGGKVTARNRAEGGATFELRIPREAR